MLILVVDDDPEDLSLLCEGISMVAPGSKCLMARDGVEALTLLDELMVLPDYIFLDINMPKMNGKQFLSHVKGDGHTRNVKVIMYSTTSNTKEIDECYQLGAEKFLIKPPDFTTLVKDLKGIF
ncbi:MAG TPA: response regulator [Chryseosolibacter sp.]|nr:response regulator [Chryseosolibacter sp.]